MKDSFREAKMQGGDVALPMGWDYKEISVPPAEAEWVLTNNFSVEVISRWFGVPTQKLGDSKVKYNNVESMGIEFLQDTMSPIASKIEAEYTAKTFVLSSEEDMYEDVIKNHSFRQILHEIGGRKLTALFGAQPVSAERCFIDLIR